jgi:hypothetical protein
MHNRWTLMLLVLVALSMLGSDGSGCLWSAATFCAAGQTPYTCQEQLQELSMLGGMNGLPIGSICTRSKVLVCVDDTSNPQGQAIYLAKVKYGPPKDSGYAVLNVGCHPGIDPDVNTDPNFHPQDYPSCDATISGTGGSSTTSTSCAADTDLCSSDTDCCSGICSDQGACEPCRMELEGCTTDAECCSHVCSLNACGGTGGHRAPHPHGSEP